MRLIIVLILVDLSFEIIFFDNCGYKFGWMVDMIVLFLVLNYSLLFLKGINNFEKKMFIWNLNFFLIFLLLNFCFKIWLVKSFENEIIVILLD